MKTTSVQIQVPAALMSSPDGSIEALTAQAQLLLAVKCFELGLLNFGQAAELCEMTRADFLESAKSLGVPVEGDDL